MEHKKYEKEIAGRTLRVEVGKLAQQANGSVLVSYGGTTVLVTATMAGRAGNSSWFPLSVSYEERYYAAGKIKGSKWIKRETRPSDDAVLSGRVIDRTIRPRFDNRIRNDIQVVATILSFDRENDADIVALFGTSLALMISDIPFAGPVAGVRIGRVDGKHIINPTYAQRDASDMDIIVAGTDGRINMLEAGLKEVTEEDTAAAIDEAYEQIAPLIAFQKEIASEIGLEKKVLDVGEQDEELVAEVRKFVAPLLEERLYVGTKMGYVDGIHSTEDDLDAHLKEKYAEHPELDKKLKEGRDVMEEEMDRIVHTNVVKHGKRLDGRGLDELRELSAETGGLPNTHGTGLFNRGTTQALSVLTLGAPGMEQWIETMEVDLTKVGFMHHYVFPPFSVGETGRIGFPGRREIGHGALAQKALEPLIPSKEDFPYTIRLVSEILSSNGSSSMASVCGSTLALMDGGVPIKTPAAGIAMGLMLDADGDDHKVLTDIQGPEDHHGDMDLKVAGTKDGITALQMDVKIDGIDGKIVAQTLAQAKKARLEILDVITAAISEPRKELATHAPRIKTVKVDKEKIGAIIGSGGKTINAIIERTGVEIDIEDDGLVFITSPNKEGLDAAVKEIEQIVYEPKAGDEFDGKITRLLDFGAMVEYLPGKEGLVHVSQISKEHVKKPSDVLKVGQDVHVKVKNIDDYGRINLTMLN